MIAEALIPIRTKALAALRPPPRLALSDWIEGNIRLPSSLSATPGRMKLWPWQKEIADVMGDDTHERVTVLKSARVGFSQLLTGVIGSYAVNDPSPILCVLPAEGDCRSLMVTNLEPTFSESPSLVDTLSDSRGRDTIFERHFPGGHIKCVSAGAPRNLRGHTARIVILDEVDGFEVDLKGEGDPVNLAIRRSQTFSNRKIIMGSTPVHEETSKVCTAYDLSDKRIYEVDCPHCGEPFEIQWKDIKWPEGKPSEAYCVCPSHGCVIEHSEKPSMVEKGQWRATAPDVTGHAGFKLNSLISTLPNAAWGRLAEEFLAAKKSPETLQTFVNTVLGDPWKDQLGAGLEASSLQSQALPFSLDAIPVDVELLTMGVDVQEDRLAIVALGFNSGQSKCFVLHHNETWGSPYEDHVWRDLDALQKRLFTREDGQLIKFGAVAIDAGSGSHMDTVLAYCRPRSRTFAVKGAGGFQRPIITASKTRGGQLQILGVDSIKKQLFDRFNARTPPIFFSNELPGQFYEELTSERLITKFSRGAPVRYWQRVPGRRAESLDAMGYAWAIRNLIGSSSLIDRSESMHQSKIVRSQWIGLNK